MKQARNWGKTPANKANAIQYFSQTSSWVSPFVKLKQEASKPVALKKSTMVPAASSVATVASQNTPGSRLDVQSFIQNFQQTFRQLPPDQQLQLLRST